MDLKSNKKQRGSALVLTVIVLVNALLIVAAISAISILERKMTSRTRNSAPAFQAADSGVEWVLYQVNDENPTEQTLTGVFGAGGMDVGTGRYDCPAALGVDCEFYFTNVLGEVVTNEDTLLVDLDSVRVIGRHGEDEERASRAIEVVLEIANCPPDFIPVSDFCIQADENSTSEEWEEASRICTEDHNGRLCSSAEWMTSCALSEPGNPLEGEISNMTNGFEWVDDFTDVNEVVIIGNGSCSNAILRSPGNTYEFHCCVNLQQ